MSTRTRSVLRGLQVAAAITVVAIALLHVVRRWGEVREASAHLEPRWTPLVGSAVLVLLTYAVLVEVWRAILAGWGARLPFGAAARIWSVSSLGRYIPGRIWQLGTMAVMAQRRGVPPIAAGGSAVVSTIITTVSGLAVAAACGAGVLVLSSATIVAIIFSVAAVLLLPAMLPTIARLASAVLRRPVEVPTLPPRVLWTALIGSAVAWLLFGVAFQLLVRGVVGLAPGGTLAYVAIFAGSYLAGYLALFTPAGLGVREITMGAALRLLGFGDGAAILVVVASRLWLTVLEVLPAIAFLLAGVPGDARARVASEER